MEITEIKVQLKEAVNRKLKAYAAVTFDDQFVVRFVKVIQGNHGLFIAMPTRKLKIFCSRCGRKIEMRSRFCNWCGIQLPPPSRDLDRTAVQQQHQDIAHPINQQFREYLQGKVLEAYERELKRFQEGSAPQGPSNPEPSNPEPSKTEEVEPQNKDNLQGSSGIDLSKLDF